ncbi:MAG: DUF1232 domain-containing protein [Cellulomonas sp.]|uniref:DUF1232 domain-containing protein n=1 Tax=Cellulomonas sp. TaxID=40001 RepID=UPI00178D17E7|nr:DUF1232 domain-containing protein [Cellulomonas sp.]NMM17223.1 DUF1232 domain-containing protein [Cellulomonas sp.]NMM29878.1 DUF1232 domain-containing protein [Cellulomonas sp.]
MHWWQIALGVVGGVLLVYVVLLALLWQYARTHPDTVQARDVLRLVPDLLRLLRSVAADPTVPRRARVGLVLLLAYLLMPFDLVPDMIPVIGYADDVVIVAVVLRAVVRAAGPDALARHWSGTPQGLAVVARLAGIAAPSGA